MSCDPFKKKLHSMNLKKSHILLPTQLVRDTKFPSYLIIPLLASHFSHLTTVPQTHQSFLVSRNFKPSVCQKPAIVLTQAPDSVYTELSSWLKIHRHSTLTKGSFKVNNRKISPNSISQFEMVINS